MQSNNNEAAILPINSFLEKSFPFTDITLHLSADAITFLMGTTKGRLNLMYYLYILHTMTIGARHPCRYRHLPMFALGLFP